MAQAAEVPALMPPAKPLPIEVPVTSTVALGEVVRLHGGADLDEVLGVDPELGDLPLGLDLGDGELAALGLGDVLRLDGPGAELQRGIAVLVSRALAHHRQFWPSTVTGTCVPSSLKMRVMPSFVRSNQNASVVTFLLGD